MNLYLHGIDRDPCPVSSGVDSLASDPGDRFSMILTNPPFGKKSSISIVNEEGELEKEDYAYERQNFWTTTKNKQLNFLQHVKTLLKIKTISQSEYSCLVTLALRDLILLPGKVKKSPTFPITT
jgi:type I restriction enzyme M protein